MLKSLKKSSGRWLLAVGIALGMIAGYAFHVSRNPDGAVAQLDAAEEFPTLGNGSGSGATGRKEKDERAAGTSAPREEATGKAAAEPDSRDDSSSKGGREQTADARDDGEAPKSDATSEEKKLAKATFGMGCFWCSEAFFESLKGVASVEAGYSGGRVPNPTYAAVCTGRTGHAEVAQITYDPQKISYANLLEVFWRTHDPTTLNRQGNDFGEQYRSVIFYHNEEQKKAAVKYRKLLTDAKVFRRPIVTQIQPFKKFYKAGEDHQDYYKKNSRRLYCRVHIRPTLEKMREVFGDAMKQMK